MMIIARSLTSSKDDRPAMSVDLSPSSFFASQRVSVMYVCFDFSLARSRRTRTIDLQCQSLSLRRAVLLCSVRLSLHRTVESYAVRWPTHSQNQAKIIAKINRKSIPGDTSGPPKSTQNRSGTLSGHTMASKSVPKASREGLWSVPEHPRRAAGASGWSLTAPRDARKGALERPGARRGDQN